MPRIEYAELGQRLCVLRFEAHNRAWLEASATDEGRGEIPPGA